MTERFSAAFRRMSRGFDPSGVQYNCPVLLLRDTTERNEIVTWPLLSTRYLQEILVRHVECQIYSFAELWKATISFFTPVCPSVRSSVCPIVILHGITRLSLDGFSWTLAVFSENWSGDSTTIEIWRESRYFTWRSMYIFYLSRSVHLEIKSVWDKSCTEKKKIRCVQ
jgi:hypothetical protein